MVCRRAAYVLRTTHRCSCCSSCARARERLAQDGRALQFAAPELRALIDGRNTAFHIHQRLPSPSSHVALQTARKAVKKALLKTYREDIDQLKAEVKAAQDQNNNQAPPQGGQLLQQQPSLQESQAEVAVTVTTNNYEISLKPEAVTTATSVQR